jgi:GTP cyclohydrolase I
MKDYKEDIRQTSSMAMSHGHYKELVMMLEFEISSLFEHHLSPFIEKVR